MTKKLNIYNELDNGNPISRQILDIIFDFVPLNAAEKPIISIQQHRYLNYLYIIENGYQTEINEFIGYENYM